MSTDRPPLLRVSALTKKYEGTVALDAVDFDVLAGEVRCLVGENGAGKSTLIKMIAGAVDQDAGTIEIDGREVSGEKVGNRGVSVIYQDLNLVPHLTVTENTFLGHELRTPLGTLDKKAMRRAAQALIDDFGVAFSADSRVGDLGISLQQLTATARALSLDGRVLIMDEPSAVLVGQELEVLFDVIRKLKSQGIGIIYISHRLEEIFSVGDRVTVLRDGKHVTTTDVASIDRPELIRLMVGRELGDYVAEDRGSEPGEVLLSVEGLSRKGVLHDIDLTVRAGEVVGIAGLVGAGRTELARAIMGLDRASSGTISWLGRPLGSRSPARSVRMGMSMVPEDRRAEGLVQMLSVRDNISLGLMPTHAPVGIVRYRAMYARAQELAKELAVKAFSLKQPVSGLSGGNQQKVVLAKCLATGCRLLILDEPTVGIDVGAKKEIYSLIEVLKRNGLGVIVISAELPEILALSDRILVMAGGTITAELDPRITTQEEILASAIPPLEQELATASVGTESRS